MFVRIYRRRPPGDAAQHAVFKKSAQWGPERGGERAPSWRLVAVADLERPDMELPFDPAAALAAIETRGVFTFIQTGWPRLEGAYAALV